MFADSCLLDICCTGGKRRTCNCHLHRQRVGYDVHHRILGTAKLQGLQRADGISTAIDNPSFCSMSYQASHSGATNDKHGISAIAWVAAVLVGAPTPSSRATGRPSSSAAANAAAPSAARCAAVLLRAASARRPSASDSASTCILRMTALVEECNACFRLG